VYVLRGNGENNQVIDFLQAVVIVKDTA